MPEFFPGKRALAIGLCVYHSAVSTVLFQAPRFIPFSFGAFFEASVWFHLLRAPHTPELILPALRASRYKVTPEIVWGCMHGFLGLGFVTWWQGTVAYTQMMKKME
jgi:hypothetical protein